MANPSPWKRIRVAVPPQRKQGAVSEGLDPVAGIDPGKGWILQGLALHPELQKSLEVYNRLRIRTARVATP